MSNSIFGFSSNIKIGFRMSKYDIWLQFECQNRISVVKIRYLNVRIGFGMSIYDIWPQCECQNKISNVKTRYSASVRTFKEGF